MRGWICMTTEAFEGLTTKKILEEAYKRLLPAAAYLISSSAGFAASVVVFTTWLIKTSRGKYKYFSIKEDDKVVAKLLNDIKEQEARIRLLEKAREKLAKEGGYTGSVDEIIKAEKNVLENLRIELEFRQLRLEALRRLKSIGDPKVMKAVEEMVEKIEKDEKFEEQQYMVLKELEEKWRRKEIEINALREVLKHV